MQAGRINHLNKQPSALVILISISIMEVFPNLTETLSSKPDQNDQSSEIDDTKFSGLYIRVVIHKLRVNSELIKSHQNCIEYCIVCTC